MAIVVVGAGLAGLSVAHSLLADFGAQLGGHEVVVVDRGDPMALTSGASTGGYRNFFPADPTMTSFVKRSIARFERLSDETGNAFELNRRGYLFLTDSQEEFERLTALAKAAEANGSGPIRLNAHEPSDPFSVDPSLWGFDLVDSPSVIRERFPFVTDEARYMKHVRCAGYMNVGRLGEVLLRGVRSRGGRVVRGELARIHWVEGPTGRQAISGVEISGVGTIAAKAVVLAVGPHLNQVARELLGGLQFPLKNEIHAKAVIRDPLGLFPQTAPFTLWNVPTTLYWSEEEKAALAQDQGLAWLLRPIPPADHLRPLSDAEAGGTERKFAGIWTYDCPTVDDPVYPIVLDERYGEIVFRGLVSLVPALKRYFTDPQHDWRSMVEVVKGYYCKTPENLPLIGPASASIDGVIVCGALSGIGVMCSQAAGELASMHTVNHIAGGEAAALPPYAKHFLPTRYSDPEFLTASQKLNAKSGQL